MGFFRTDENAMALGSVDVCRPRKYNKAHQIVHIKMVNFVVHELYINFRNVNVTVSFIIYSVCEYNRLKHGARNQKKTLVSDRSRFRFL